MLIEDHTSRCLRQVGIKALTELAERPDVTTDDLRLIDATLSVALAPWSRRGTMCRTTVVQYG